MRILYRSIQNYSSIEDNTFLKERGKLGPYKVLQNIGIMAYKLDLPASSRVPPVFHVSCLKKVIGENIPVQTIFLELDEEGNIILEPEAVTKTRNR